MKSITAHIVAPAVLPLLFFVVASTPVEILGCRLRGLLAVIIALSSGVAAITSALVGARGRMRNQPQAVWWIATSIIFTIPVGALLILA